MIPFFRKIRKRFADDNKPMKYARYAIGEIVLVVIGILIALQINNWNESRKDLKAEKATINNLKLEFQKNTIELEDNIVTIEAIINAGQVLLANIGPNYENGTLKNVDSLISMTPRMSIWDPSLYTLSDIKNSGKLSNLSNEDLKLELISWETFYSNLIDWSDFHVERGSAYFDFLVENAINRNLNNSGPIQLGMSKFNDSNEKLLKMQSFESILSHRVTHNMFMLNYYKEAKERLQKIIELSNTYDNN
ncbi:MAG: hypothetical protein KC469_07185 [Flavobacteriaceae bacterium]|nr:hypothetical protein [Flavobacteriaceae bacterium]